MGFALWLERHAPALVDLADELAYYWEPMSDLQRTFVSCCFSAVFCVLLAFALAKLWRPRPPSRPEGASAPAPAPAPAEPLFVPAPAPAEPPAEPEPEPERRPPKRPRTMDAQLAAVRVFRLREPSRWTADMEARLRSADALGGHPNAREPARLLWDDCFAS